MAFDVRGRALADAGVAPEPVRPDRFLRRLAPAEELAGTTDALIAVYDDRRHADTSFGVQRLTVVRHLREVEVVAALD